MATYPDSLDEEDKILKEEEFIYCPHKNRECGIGLPGGYAFMCCVDCFNAVGRAWVKDLLIVNVKIK